MREPAQCYGGYGGPPGGPPPGGYGGPPGSPPGFPPPPGAPPPGGGYGGPPPGGYGAPPPQGPQPGYPAPGAPQPGPPKKQNVALWIGIGCGLLLFLAVIAGAIVWYVTVRTQQALEEIAASAVPLVPGAPAPAGSAGSGGATCEKAVACCKALIAKSGAEAKHAAGCDALRQVGEAQCAQQHQTYQQSARLLGVQCE